MMMCDEGFFGGAAFDHDSKIRPALLNEMGDQVQPEVPGWDNGAGFIRPYENRVKNESGKYYEPVLDSINSSFKENWPNMTDEEKMR